MQLNFKEVFSVTKETTGQLEFRNSANQSLRQVSTLGFIQNKQGGEEKCWKLHLMCFLHHLQHLLPSTSYSPPLWQWVYRKLASTKTWWAYKSPAADRGRCLASRVGGDQDLITLCHRALGWKTQICARAKMASGEGNRPHAVIWSTVRARWWWNQRTWAWKLNKNTNTLCVWLGVHSLLTGDRAKTKTAKK